MENTVAKLASYKRDKGLQTRIWVTSFLFILLYTAFAYALWFFGVSLFFIVPIVFVFSFIQWWYSDTIILGVSKAKKITEKDHPKIYKMVKNLSDRVGIKMPQVAIINTPVPNAFATGRSKNKSTVAVTTGLVNLLNDDELEAVLGHEIGHVMNRDVTMLAFANFFIAITSFLITVLFWNMLFGRSSSNRGNAALIALALYAITWVVYIIATLLVTILSRSREYVADHTGAELTGKPSALASALRKISTPTKMNKKDTEKLQSASALCTVQLSSKIGGLFATHPPVEQRIKRLQEMVGMEETTNFKGGVKKAKYNYKYVKYEKYSWDQK